MEKKLKNGGVVRLETYNSIAELHSSLKNGKQREAWKSTSIFNNESYFKKWGGETPQDALDKLYNGDAENAKKIKGEGEILNEKYGGSAPKIEVGVYGCIPSVPNYLRGVPANMMRVVRQPRRNPVIDIYVEDSIYDGINTQKVAEKAAIIANVITKTEMEGVRVNLYAINTAADGCSNSYYATCVKIKDAQAPLNLLNIAFAITNRAMHRAIFLMWLEQNVDERLSGYGRPMRGEETKKQFELDGIVLSIRDMVDRNESITDVVNKINQYLKN